MHEGRPGPDGAESSLGALLARHPGAWVVAIDPNGIFVSVPESLVVQGHQIVEGASSALDLVTPDHTATVIDTWARAKETGAACATVQLVSAAQQPVDMHFLDLTRRHGVFVGVFAGEGDAPIVVRCEEATAFRARVCTMRQDERARIVAIDEAFTEILGWTPEELVGKGALDLCDPVDAERAIADWMHLLANPGYNRRIRLRRRHRDGSWRWFEISKQNRLADPEYRCVVQELVDISDEMAAQESLRVREQQYRTIIETAHEGIWMLDARGTTTFANCRMAELLAADPAELFGLPASEIAVGIDDASNVAAALCHRHHGVAVQREQVLLRRDGSTVHCLVTATPVTGEDGGHGGVVAMVSDLTAQQRLEMELQQAQRLEAVGRLAAGLAHEINTPIQFVGDNVEFLAAAFESLLVLVDGCRSLLRDGSGGSSALLDAAREAEAVADVDFLGEEVPEAIEQLRAGWRRVAAVVAAMKAFGAPDADDVSAVDLDECLRNTLVVCHGEYAEVADVDVRLGGVPPVPGVAGSLNQAFMHLVVNAAHSIADARESGGPARGRITVSTSHEGDGVVVRIGDTGTGIPAAIRSRVFEQFFTTKEVGRGTGQGLSVVRSVVVDQHGGRVWFDTAPGRGTTFCVRLPLSTGERLPGRVSPPAAATAASGAVA